MIPPPMRSRAGGAVVAVLAGAALLVWPAFLNGYPIVFSDTGAFLAQTLVPLMIWDKPYVYGPFLHLFHQRLSLWGPLVAQGLILSHLLWVTQRALRGAASPTGHLAVTAGLAALTSAPWTAAFLMPDLFAPVTVLSLALLGLARDRVGSGEAWYLSALATLAIASHLAHLVIAAGVVAAVFVLTWRTRPVLRAAAPLGAALALLLASNAIGHGRLAVSPYGATFLLARLQDDGPATRTLRALCPGAGWRLCDFLDRLPMDSDEFLWSPDSPLYRGPDGAPLEGGVVGGARMAPEAQAILRATVLREPLGVAAAMLHNTLRQLLAVRADDTLHDRFLSLIPGREIGAHFPPGEIAAFLAGAQKRGVLEARAAPFLAPHLPVLVLAVLLLPLALWRVARVGDGLRLGLLVCVLVGLLANAFATGALSGPHDRYQARIVWLLPLAVGLSLWPAGGGWRRAAGGHGGVFIQGVATRRSTPAPAIHPRPRLKPGAFRGSLQSSTRNA
jgi:hypothetical protein